MHPSIAKEIYNVDELLPGLFLTSNFGFKKFAKETRIDLAICTAYEHVNDTTLNEAISKCKKYIEWPIYDSCKQHILDDNIFTQLVDQILAALDEKKCVVVFCHLGVSRSATLCCACLIRSLKIQADEALYLIKLKRPIIQPNAYFLEQLNKFALLENSI